MRSLKTCAQTMPQAAYSKWNNLRIAFALKPTRIDGTVQDRTDNSTWAAVGHAEARSRAVVPQSATNLCFQSVPMPRGASRLIRRRIVRSEEHTSELQSLMRISYAVFCLKKKKKTRTHYKSQYST